MIRILFLLLLGTPLFGQNLHQIGATKPLKEGHGYPPNEISLQIRNIDSLGHYTIYLVNNGQENLIVNSLHHRLDPIAEISRDSGEWQPETPRYYYCTTGMVFNSILPAKHYSWVHQPKFEGKVPVQLRFKVIVNDSTIYSAPISATVDPFLYFHPYGRQIARHEEALLQEGLTDKERSRRIYSIGALCYKAKYLQRALTYFDKAIEIDPTNYKARYVKGHTYLKAINKCAHNDPKLNTGLLVMALREWEKIPEGETYTNYKIGKTTIKFRNGLLTKSEWEKDNTLPTKISIDGKTLYYFDCFINDYIELIFKE